jgi:hypothetical protein
MLRNFDDRRLCWILHLHRIAAYRILNFQSRIGRNSESTEYHFRRKLSQISDGPLDGSKRLVVCESRKSKTRPVAESIWFSSSYSYGLFRHTVWSLQIFEVRFQRSTDSRQPGYTGAWSSFWGTRRVILASVLIQLLRETKSAFWRLLKHMFLITVLTITAV